MSTPAPSPATGLPAFAFEPHPPELSGAAYGPIFKALAWGMSTALLLWMLRLQLPWHQDASILAWGAWTIMSYTAWVVQHSRLHLSTTRIAQDWMWRKQVAVAELVSLSVWRVRGLEWLLAPRVYARTRSGSRAVFHCADTALLAELERLSVELARWREQLIHGA